MIVLDTNVISETMKPSANPLGEAWLNKQVAETLYLFSVTLAEVPYGIGSLPTGRRKDALAGMLDGLLGLLGDRVLLYAPMHGLQCRPGKAARDFQRRAATLQP